MAESKQHWLGRNRPPRVHITYDVEIGGAVEKKELPLVVGVLSWLSGENDDEAFKKRNALKGRKFVAVDKDNFDAVLQSMEPVFKMGETVVRFESMSDFRPESVVRQAASLRDLHQSRTRLNDLRGLLDANPEVGDKLTAKDVNHAQIAADMESAILTELLLDASSDAADEPGQKPARDALVALLEQRLGGKMDVRRRDGLVKSLRFRLEALKEMEQTRALLAALAALPTDNAIDEALSALAAKPDDAGANRRALAAVQKLLKAESKNPEEGPALVGAVRTEAERGNLSLPAGTPVNAELKSRVTALEAEVGPAASLRKAYEILKSKGPLAEEVEQRWFDRTPEVEAFKTALGKLTLPVASAPAPASGELFQAALSTKDPKAHAERRHTAHLLREVSSQAASQRIELSPTSDLGSLLQRRIVEIDREIGRQLDGILHEPAFQRVESAWRGLHYLVRNSELGTHLKIRVLNITKKELGDDFEKAADFDRSLLFKKIYEEEYGTFGGQPFGLLVGDYEFGSSSPDVNLLTELSKVAAAAHAPFLAAAQPDLFGLKSFTDIGTRGDLAMFFEGSQLIKWREFRESEDARYVTLVLPRVLLRQPYHPKDNPVDGFTYEENVHAKEELQADEDGEPQRFRVGEKHPLFLFGNAAYALAQRITNAFALYRWCAAIRGVEGGGLVEGLPVHLFRTSEGDVAVKCPTEVAITDRRENELSNLGFIALCYKKNSAQAAFFGSQTANKPKTYDLSAANANALLSAQLPYILAASRFAHYLKVMMRDKVGSFASKENVASFLNNWIAQYVLLNDSAGQETKARLPLREARVDVFDIPGKPGSYRAVAFLKPHFQLNELTVSLRLVADLPPPAQG